MCKLLIRLSSLTLLVAMVASKVPCWGPTYQLKAPEALK
ncbi:MAG: cyclic lactone autoinducer peptide [Oscillospiraceae bacterium]|nr:cyclic lactone autoinducer peptide [Oscillospiraceae bacterium]